MGKERKVMESREHRAIHVPPGEGKMLWLVGDLVTFKIVGEDVNGAFTLGEEITQPQGGPPPHLHTREDETFYVVEGELEFIVGEQTLLASTGSVVYAPRNILHAFKNIGTTPSRMIVLISPAGLERMVEEFGEPVTDPSSPPEGPPDVERLVAVSQKYGVQMPPPPPPPGQ